MDSALETARVISCDGISGSQVVRIESKEIGPGLLHAMLGQLGLTKDDLP